MDKKLCDRILQHFDFKTMEVLKDYIDYRTKVLTNLITTEKDMDNIRREQGMLVELTHLSKIRDNALAIAQQER